MDTFRKWLLPERHKREQRETEEVIAREKNEYHRLDEVVDESFRKMREAEQRQRRDNVSR